MKATLIPIFIQTIQNVRHHSPHLGPGIALFQKLCSVDQIPGDAALMRDYRRRCVAVNNAANLVDFSQYQTPASSCPVRHPA
jgi:hypothetical protein